MSGNLDLPRSVAMTGTALDVHYLLGLYVRYCRLLFGWDYRIVWLMDDKRVAA